VTLKGEVFYVSDILTVKDLQDRLQEESGIPAEEQGSVSFQGQILEPTAVLPEIGVSSGDQVNMIPQKMADHWRMMNDMRHGLVSLQTRMNLELGGFSAERLREFAIMANLYENLAKVPFMQEEMENFCQHLKNPEVAGRATDPERVESLRQIILNNPIMLKMLSETSPATNIALKDSELWLQHVIRAVKEWKTMNSYQLWQRLVEGRLFGV
jgi:Ubiquitin family